MSILPEQFKARVQATIAAHGMIAPGERVLVAVSGGPDSVALLDVLVDLGHAVEVAHLDHRARGVAGAADAEFVGTLAGALGVPYHRGAHPVAEEAAQLGKSFEEHARDARYAFLTRTAAARGCAVIATGHHLGDVAETVLLRLARGASPGGLGGIPPVRMVDGVRVARPLIDCARAWILAWLEEGGLAYREDETNADTRHLRNRIRHDLLPRLRAEYNPKIDAALLRLAEAARVENDYLHRLAEKAYPRVVDGAGAVDREGFRGLHEALRRRVIQRLAWGLGVDCPYARVVEAAAFVAEAPTGQHFDLGGGVAIYAGRTRAEPVRDRPAADPAETPLAVPGSTIAFGLRFEARLLDAPPEAPLDQYCGPLRQVFDARALGVAPVVRHRRDGDRFAPLGLGGAKKLQDYFVDAAVPAPARDAVPLVVAGDTIAWIVGHATSAVTAVRPDTAACVEISVAPCD